MLFTTSTSPKHRSPKTNKAQVVERLNLSKLIDEESPTPLSEAEVTQCISKLLAIEDPSLTKKFFEKVVRASQLSHKQLVMALQCLQTAQLFEEAIKLYEDAQAISSRSGNLGEAALLEYMKAATCMNCNVDAGRVLDTYRLALTDSVNYPQLAVNSKAVYYAFKLCGCIPVEGVERALAIRALLRERDIALHYSNLALLIALSVSQNHYEICQELYEEYRALQERRGFSVVVETQMLAAAQRVGDTDNALIILQQLLGHAAHGLVMDQRAVATMLSTCCWLVMWDSGCQLMEQNLNKFPVFEAVLATELDRFIVEYENMHNSPSAISSVQTVLEADFPPTNETKVPSPASMVRAAGLRDRIEQLKIELSERRQLPDTA